MNANRAGGRRECHGDRQTHPPAGRRGKSRDAGMRNWDTAGAAAAGKSRDASMSKWDAVGSDHVPPEAEKVMPDDGSARTPPRQNPGRRHVEMGRARPPPPLQRCGLRSLETRPGVGSERVRYGGRIGRVSCPRLPAFNMDSPKRVAARRQRPAAFPQVRRILLPTPEART